VLRSSKRTAKLRNKDHQLRRVHFFACFFAMARQSLSTRCGVIAGLHFCDAPSYLVFKTDLSSNAHSARSLNLGRRVRIWWRAIEVNIALREHVPIRKGFFPSGFSRILAKIYPALVKPTPTVTMTVITAIKAMTVGIAAAIAEGLLLRIDVHFKFARSS